MQKAYTRKNLRMPLFDYSDNGYYFVTICTKKRIKYFGHIEYGKIIFNELGIIA
ncbi:MAG: hypothetical protein V3575_02925 [Candidatus Absconditabacteria bacterium]